MHPWKIIFQLLIFVIVATFTIVVGVDNDQLSVCGPTTASDDSLSSLIFVTTLDGKISALDLANNGETKWTVDFNEGPLISSSVHRRELNNDGRWIKLIPSLNGRLYKFDGENVEPMPVTTDQLLHSSYRYTDDLVFSGGKEIRSYGISLKNGQIVYHCTINGCTNRTNGDSYIKQEDILIVKRYQQTVRAVEPRTGQERWNYSVGQHELLLIPQENRDCNDNILNKENNIDIELKAVVPDGIIYAINKNNPILKLWEYKFDSPIVSIWRENTLIIDDSDNKLRQINLFDSKQWSWGVEFTVSPDIYIGMYDRQLYVQENIDNDKLFELPPTSINIYPWQPYPAIQTAIALSNNNDNEKLMEDKNEDNALLNPNYESQATALSVLYNSEYINGNGFYLFNKHQSENLYKCNHTNANIHVVDNESMSDTKNVDTDGKNSLELSIQIMISSLWHWWREVIIIAITTAFLLNYFLTQRLLNAATRSDNTMVTPIIVERHIEMKAAGDEAVKISMVESVDEFKSRYLSDFVPINCLGKGGYGVVFEAKNIIDDCNYAIKRIALPNSKDSRDRVLREVKALAKLDHHNIVRYFHAWLECPPAGWQEKHDQLYINKQLFTPSQCPTTTATTTDNYSKNAKDNGSAVCIDVPSSERSSIDSAAEAVEINYRNNDDSSFIIFDSSPSDDLPLTEEYNDDLSTTNNSSMLEIVNNNCLNDDENNSMSIVFKNSTDNSIKCDSSLKQHRKSYSSSLNKRKKDTNKKVPKMFLYIQMQLCQRLSLREWLKRESSSRNYSRIVDIFQQIVDAVEYVHLQGLIHRDLKPSNVFFAYDNKVKIGDFGLVTAIPENCNGHKPCTPNENNIYINNSDSIISKNCNHTACVGTKLYMSPEQMNEQVYDYKVDIYSIGIILFELLTPFNTEMERIMALMDLRKSIFPKDFATNYPNEYDLLKMMLDDNPSKRPTTLGMKARLPLSNCANADKSIIDDGKWHFELPHISRHSSTTGISNSTSSGNS